MQESEIRFFNRFRSLHNFLNKKMKTALFEGGVMSLTRKQRKKNLVPKKKIPKFMVPNKKPPNFLVPNVLVLKKIGTKCFGFKEKKYQHF